MFYRFDQLTFKYDRYTDGASSERKFKNNASEYFLPSLHCFLLRSSGFKCNFIDFFLSRHSSVHFLSIFEFSHFIFRLFRR